MKHQIKEIKRRMKKHYIFQNVAQLDVQILILLLKTNDMMN